MALDQWFDADALTDLRRMVRAEAVAAGLPPDRADDVVLAVHELAANAVRHGGGIGRVQMHATGGSLRCRVSDKGRAAPAGETQIEPQPWRLQSGHGLWLARRVADHVAAAPGSAGSHVTVIFVLPGAAPEPEVTALSEWIRRKRAGGSQPGPFDQMSFVFARGPAPAADAR